MAKKRTKATFVKKFAPARFFVHKGRLKWQRVLLALLVVLGFALMLSDLPGSLAKLPSKMAAQEKQAERNAFIKKLAPEAQHLQSQYGVRASITLAQAVLESNWGKSELSASYNNYFGVKAGEGQPSVKLSTSEYVDGAWITVKADFRVYASWQLSLSDHAKLLAYGTSYNADQYKDVLQATTYQEAAQALYKDGYATDPDYAAKLINLIDDYQLAKYDTVK